MSRPGRSATAPSPSSPLRDEGDGRVPRQSPAGSRSGTSALHRILGRPELAALVGAIAVFIFFAVVAGDRGFLTKTGTINYLTVAAELGILAVGVALLMIAGEFDLSIGSMIGAAGVMLGLLVVDLAWPLWLALIVTFAFAGLVGALNGFLVVRTGIPSFLVTLAALFILRGLTIAVTRLVTDRTGVENVTDAVEGDPLLSVFNGTISGFPVTILWWLGLTAIGAWVLTRTRYGNWIFGSGGDQVAARNVGVPVGKVKISLFIVTALGACLVATLTVLQAGSADVLRGELKEFQAIAAAVIGGVLLTGGYGSVIGAAFGALIFGMVSQGIFFTGIDSDWFQVFLGSMLLIAVLLNQWVRRRVSGGAQ